jgi:starvation-inducible DNA-binding protein
MAARAGMARLAASLRGVTHGKKNTSPAPIAAPQIDIGIKGKDREKIVQGLSRVLADTYTLYLKTHNFHWNVEGPMFNTLHLMFMDQYTELWNALDLIAERIRRWVIRRRHLQGILAAHVHRGDRRRAGAWTWCGLLVRSRSRDAHRARRLPAAEKAGDESSCDLLTSACRSTKRPRGCCAAC